MVYLAGRHEDLQQLVGLLEEHGGCFAPEVTVLSGDDMTVVEFPGTTTTQALAPQMTLYYAAQTDPDDVAASDNNSQLNRILKTALSLRTRPKYGDPAFASGLIALGYDAANVLYNASTTNGRGQTEVHLHRAEVEPHLRCFTVMVTHAATGHLGFTDVQHGLYLFKAVNTTSGPDPQKVSEAGNRPTITENCAPNVK